MFIEDDELTLNFKNISKVKKIFRKRNASIIFLYERLETFFLIS